MLLGLIAQAQRGEPFELASVTSESEPPVLEGFAVGE